MQPARYKRSSRRARTVAIIALVSFLPVCAVLGLIGSILSPPLPAPRPAASSLDGNGTVLWEATGYRMDDGWGMNLAGSGRQIQIYPGTSTDLEVDSGYLSSAGHLVFLPPGTAPTYQACLTAVGPASSQEEPLTAITPGRSADLCAIGSFGEIAYLHITRNDHSGLTMNITIWNYII